jgi:hypothetical protein
MNGLNEMARLIVNKLAATVEWGQRGRSWNRPAGTARLTSLKTPSARSKNLADALEPGRSFVIWGGYANLMNYPAALAGAGLGFHQGIIWDKQWPVLTRKDFMGAHEWAFYGWKEGAAHYFNPEIKNAADLCPVELAERAMTYSSKRSAWAAALS